MVKRQKKDTRNKRSSKGFKTTDRKAKKIDASTSYETCTEQLSPFGGLLAMIKFLDLIRFHDIFQFAYNAPERKPKLGHHFMVIGVLMLLFIGFNRLWHFVYIRLDPMLCGFFRLTSLPAASTFWRYVDSLGINQANSFLKVMNIIRERVWQLFDFRFDKIHLSVDTTVETIYGHQQGGRKGHNTKHRGKKGYRPVLCFIDETREYLAGKLRKGETISGEETAAFISQIKSYLPGCVKEVLLRADGEFLSWQSVQACITAGFQFVIANKRCDPPFDTEAWYRPWKQSDIEYNSCIYKPIGWEIECRFVAMRIPKEQNQIQGELFEENRYTYRIFCTDLKGKAHHVIAEYDKRADVENLVGEAKREGLDAIPSSKFKNNYAFFQIVMLAYNIWRYMKIMAQKSTKNSLEANGLKNLMTNTIRIARLKLLLIAAKVVTDSNVDKVKYSIHDTRTSLMMKFLNFIDKARGRSRPWDIDTNWPQRFRLQPS